jgi:predicted MFS family arabinose efflux permease
MTHEVAVGVRRYTLFLLTLTYAIAFLDRQVLSITQESIKHELGLSDSQLGLLTGLAFSLFFVLIGIPVARFADRSNRRNVAVASLAIWSTMTGITGMAQNYLFLLASRVGVGIGEGGCNPPSYSIIADLYPREKRAAAFSLYTMGANIGVLAGFLFGGFLTHRYGWRMTFAVLGFPGLALALLMRLTMREPIRQLLPLATKRQSFWADLHFLSTWPTLRHLALAVALSALVSVGSLSWTAPFLMRSHHLPIVQVGAMLAMIIGIGGALASFGCGALADRLARNDVRWYVRVPAVVNAGLIPLFLVGYLVPATPVALFVLAMPLAFGTAFAGVSLTVLNTIAPSSMRATASALFLLATNLFGVGLGSWLIGEVSDSLAGSMGHASLGYALAIILPIGALWSAVHYLLASRSIRRDFERASALKTTAANMAG